MFDGSLGIKWVICKWTSLWNQWTVKKLTVKCSRVPWFGSSKIHVESLEKKGRMAAARCLWEAGNLISPRRFNSLQPIRCGQVTTAVNEEYKMHQSIWRYPTFFNSNFHRAGGSSAMQMRCSNRRGVFRASNSRAFPLAPIKMAPRWWGIPTSPFQNLAIPS